MKKQFKTFTDETAILFDKICFSGGRVGYQVMMSPDSLIKAVNPQLADLTK